MNVFLFIFKGQTNSIECIRSPGWNILKECCIAYLKRKIFEKACSICLVVVGFIMIAYVVFQFSK